MTALAGLSFHEQDALARLHGRGDVHLREGRQRAGPPPLRLGGRGPRQPLPAGGAGQGGAPCQEEGGSQEEGGQASGQGRQVRARARQSPALQRDLPGSPTVPQIAPFEATFMPDEN